VLSAHAIRPGCRSESPRTSPSRQSWSICSAPAATQKNQAAQQEIKKANEARDKELDRKMKGTMGTIFKGC
jgi:hypothetical protein